MRSPTPTGNDSFLDIVANLVGVLIILVVVVGSQATEPKTVKQDENLTRKIDDLQLEIDKSSGVVEKLRTDNRQQDKLIYEESMLAARLAEQRHEMLIQFEMIQREFEKEKKERQHKLDRLLESLNEQERQLAEKQRMFDLEKQELLTQIEDKQKTLNAVSSVDISKNEIMEHFPSPIAKTVFSDEVHVLLSAGRITVVPMDALIGRMKSEWKVKAEKLKRTSRTLETAGPVGDFRIQYELFRQTEKVATSQGMVARERVKFHHFELIPVHHSTGEPIETAMENSESKLSELLGQLQPSKTTVSVWVYPDSFAEHNRLKVWLHRRGFQIASWPLEFGKRISGSPDGFKTTAQ
ncbi:MAG: hypothetical protein AAF623_00820 [Planctomycetota bacterium]